MEHAARDRLAALLGGHAMHAVSSVQLEAGVADLQLAVDGLGPIKLPVTQARARQLAQLGQPAQFGLGEQTLTDSRVRDTWEIPKDLVHAEWSDAFGTILGAIRDRLGLPGGSELAADFHSMLVYERGQFFAAHQDSEKDDSMIGTLVVTLPSAYTGGELVIEHGGQSTRYQGRPDALSLVAFYGDCRHEILPLNSGRRITLTYNLLLHGDTTVTATGDDATVAELARLVEEHFTTPVTNRYSQAKAAPPGRLVYLLDHEYTARGLSWPRLKGADAARMPLVRAAADQAGCAAVLALADVKETWSAFKAGDRYRDWDEEDDEDEDENENDGPYEIQELIDSSITLTHWTAGPARILLSVRDTEACATTRSADLRPIASEYEGYMGNYGNTLDRWYKRAAVVVWPRELEFANRAEASPAWALDELVARARDDLAGARIAAATVAELWDMTVRVTELAGLLGKALSAAAALDDASIAAMLLRPFAVERLSVADVPPLAYLAGQHGQQWTAELLRSWFGEGSRPYYAVAQGRPQWIASLPGLCRALQASPTAHLLLDLSWDWLRNMIGRGAEQQSPTYRDEALREMGPPLAALLAAAAVAEAGELRDQIVGFCREQGDEMIPCEMAALRAAAGAPGFGDLTADCTERLRRRLARPVRAADDWSIELPAVCACELCIPLGKFLADPVRRTLEWKLAKAGREHIHSRIDTAELPVQHQTRRQGSPFTLVLTKSQALFDREREARSRDEADLAALTVI
jgi:hypothetical protein